MTTPRFKPLWATLVAVVLLAVASLSVWIHEAQAQADRPAPRPDLPFLSTGLSPAALDRDVHSLDPATQAQAQRVDPARHAQLAPVGSLDLRDPSFDDARKINAPIPASATRNPPAQPFVLHASAADRAQAEQCLTQAVYFEAGREPPAGQAAVAQTVLNRLRHPDYPKSVCGVVFQGSSLKTGCQFSFTCDGSLNQPILPSAWARAKSVARRALNGYVMAAVGEATHYHADYVKPYWSSSLVKIAQIGAQIFYRWTGPAGRPAAFTGHYDGHEPQLSPAVLTGGDSRVARPDAAPADRGVIDHARTFTIADNSAPGGMRTRVSGVFESAPTAAPAPSAAQTAAPAVAVTPPAPVTAPAPPTAAPAPTIAATS